MHAGHVGLQIKQPANRRAAVLLQTKHLALQPKPGAQRCMYICGLGEYTSQAPTGRASSFASC